MISLVSPALVGPMDAYTRHLLHLAAIEAGNISQDGYREPATTLDAHLDDAIARGHAFDIGIPGVNDRWLRVEGFRIGSDDAPVFRAAVVLLIEHRFAPVFDDPDVLYRAALAKTGTPPVGLAEQHHGPDDAGAREDA